MSLVRAAVCDHIGHMLRKLVFRPALPIAEQPLVHAQRALETVVLVGVVETEVPAGLHGGGAAAHLAADDEVVQAGGVERAVRELVHAGEGEVAGGIAADGDSLVEVEVRSGAGGNGVLHGIAVEDETGLVPAEGDAPGFNVGAHAEGEVDIQAVLGGAVELAVEDTPVSLGLNAEGHAGKRERFKDQPGLLSILLRVVFEEHLHRLGWRGPRAVALAAAIENPLGGGELHDWGVTHGEAHLHGGAQARVEPGTRPQGDG